MNHLKKRVIITAKVHEFLLSALQQKGYETLYLPAIDYYELSSIISDASGLIVTTRLKIDAPLLEKAQKLQWIGRLGSGMEMIDVEFAESKGIQCVSSPEGNRNAVAEHVLGLILNLLNRISRSYEEVKQNKWIREANTGIELSGKTVGIIGFGHTGSSLAKLLAAFDTKVLAYDKYISGFSAGHIREVRFDQLCSDSDIISIHVPLTSETRYMADKQFFDSLKKQPYFINSSRGGVTDTAALIHALQSGQISGAALDVLENENPATRTVIQQEQIRFLTQHPNVIITPHIAGYSREAFYKMAHVLVEKLGI